MNKEWSDQNKKVQSLLKKSTFDEGIKELLILRNTLMDEIVSWKNLTKEQFCAIPYINAEGYHSKTVVYSLWHIFRIEDIVVHSLIKKDKEILFTNNYIKRLHTPIITTGNELKKIEIQDFSNQLDINVLYEYIQEVKEKTDEWLKSIDYTTLNVTFNEIDKVILKRLNVVSEDESAIWLIDYWCNKDIKGLIKMPLSRHWIMHIEAANRIIQKVKKN